jgi:hypothetical protein
MIASVYVTGIGVWTPTFPDWAAWQAGRPAPRVDLPPCAALPARLLRGTSVVTRVALEVAAQAIADADVPADTTPTVFGSDLGEIQTAVSLVQSVTAAEPVSPLRFKNSVHNAASGNLSIALGNRAFSTALSAGADTPAMCLLEAWAWLDAEGGDIAVVLAEEAVPAPLDARAGAYDPVGVALCLSVRPGPTPYARLSNLLRRARGAPSHRGEPMGNRCAPMLALLDPIARRRDARVSLSESVDGWSIDVSVQKGS